jgi:hypothetical protein
MHVSSSRQSGPVRKQGVLMLEEPQAYQTRGTTVHTIQAHSQELCEVNLQLVAEEQAKEQNTTVANALKAILKQE